MLINNKWHTPSEVEALAGKKAKKWRQSLLHLGKPLSAYDMSCCGNTLVNVSGPSVHSPGGSLSVSTLCGGRVDSSGGQTPASNVVPPSQSDNLSPLGQASSGPFLVNPVLAFIKAFRLQGDIVTIKRSVCEKFPSEVVEMAKKALWDHCGSVLEAASLPFHIRRDSEKRSQLSANLDDILKAFEVLDRTDSIPSIFCEASDLPRLPPISHDPIGQQVQLNTQTLHTLNEVVTNVEEKLTHLIDQTKCLLDSERTTVISPGEVGREINSYAKAASVQLPVNNTPPAPLTKSMRRSSNDDSRASNVVIFGLPEGKSIFESKSLVDEIFQFLAGRPVVINDLFRLGKYGRSPQPRPVLVKLSAIWDKKLLLSRKRNLRDFKMKRLFLREDVPPDHKLRQRTKFGEKESSGQNPSSSSADLVQVDDLTANQQLSRDRSPSLSPSTSSLTLSSGATVVLDDVNSDG